jgi:hypothetical protein
MILVLSPIPIRIHKNNSRNAFVSNRAVVQPLCRCPQILKAELQTSTTGKKLMLHVLNASFLCPFCTLLLCPLCKIGSFWEDQKPHGVVGIVQRIQVRFELVLVRFPLPGKENEIVELRAPSEDGNVLQGFFQDDVYVTVHVVRICNPPHV